jgi:hypothetical protein
MKLVLYIVLFLLALQSSFSQKEDEFPLIGWKDVFGHLSCGYKIFSWSPVDRGKFGFIEFSTEGLHALNFYSAIGLFHMEFFSYNYEGTFPNTNRQKEMITTYFAYETGLEKFTYGIKLDPLAHYIISANSFFKKYILQKLFSIRFKYSKELYYGKAKAQKEFYFVPFTANFFNSQYTPSQNKIIHVGNNINFKTLFTDNETSLSVYTADISDVRVLYFSSMWERPSDYFYYLATNNKPMILGTKFEVNGIGVSLETVDRGKPGWNFDLSLRFTGLSTRSIKNASGDFQDILNDLDSSWLNYLSYSLGVWDNIYIENKRDKGLNFTFGIVYEQRRWLREYGNDKFDVIEKDEFYKLFGNIGYRF